jgi:Transposase.
VQDKGDAYCFFFLFFIFYFCILFYYQEGILQHEYTPQGETLNHHFYLEVLRCLHDAVCHK